MICAISLSLSLRVRTSSPERPWISAVAAPLEIFSDAISEKRPNAEFSAFCRGARSGVARGLGIAAERSLLPTRDVYAAALRLLAELGEAALRYAADALDALPDRTPEAMEQRYSTCAPGTD
jgi:hypothetical protein